MPLGSGVNHVDILVHFLRLTLVVSRGLRLLWLAWLVGWLGWFLLVLVHRKESKIKL